MDKPLKERAGMRKLLGGTMDTAATQICQTTGRRKVACLAGLLCTLVVGLSLCAVGRGVCGEPPAWQNELNALRLSEAAIASLPPDRAAEADHRLSELFQRLIALYPNEAAVRKAAGDHYWRKDQTDRAVAEWGAAQLLDPTDAETASALGSAWLREGQLQSARTQFQRAVDAQPQVARYHFELANVLYLFRHQLAGLPAPAGELAITREALAHFRRSRDLMPANAEYARAYAETYYGVPEPDWQEALAAWKHVRGLSGDKPDFALTNLARVSLRLALPDQADAYLAAIRDPCFAPVRAALQRQVAVARQAKAASPRP